MDADSWLLTKWRALIFIKNSDEVFHTTKIKFWCHYIYELLDEDFIKSNDNHLQDTKYSLSSKNLINHF